jgi:PPM family protein phosphatase
MGLKEMFGRVREKFDGDAGQVSPLFETAVRCHKGKVREENQDRAGIYTTPIGALLVVADGVGGLSAGALAAQMAVDGYGNFLASVDRGADPDRALQNATQAVNQAICDKQLTAKQSMGSTVALAIVRHKTAHIGHAGDSRVYLIRKGEMSRLTRDHSIVQKMVDHGIISDAQSRSHPDASVLTRSLGQKGLELELSEVELADGDCLLLCSDGLWAYADEDAMREAATSPLLSVELSADALLNLALQGGGADNISLIVLRVLPSAPS